MDYLEFEVPAALRRHVQCIWRLREPSPLPSPQLIYPDGRCELIVHLGSPMRRQEPGCEWQLQAPELFAAQQTTPIRLAATGEVACIGVRLQPAASAAIAGNRLPAWRDRILDLRGIDLEFSRQLRAAAHVFDADPRQPRLWQLLDQRLAPFPVDARIESALQALQAAHGDIRLPVLAKAAGLSVRGFQVRFLQAVGLGAKEFSRVLRLQAVVRSLDGGEAPLARVAADTGFADQAHATRELRQLTGLTPARLSRALSGQREGDDTIRMAAAFVRGRA